MYLQTIRFAKMGPFYRETTLALNRRVTILTGANDTGKSSVLRFIELFFHGRPVGEMDVNQDHIQEIQTKWNLDTNIAIKAVLALEASDEVVHAGYQWHSGDLAHTTRVMTGQGQAGVGKIESKLKGSFDARITWPNVIIPNGRDTIGDQVELAKPNRLERVVLEAAFGGPFDADKYLGMSSVNYTRALQQANQRLAKQFQTIMPHPSSLRLTLIGVEGDRGRVLMQIHDRHEGVTPFGLRGTGVKKITSLMAELLIFVRMAGPKLILIDEPENSLHADAQHLLREFLFSLTGNGSTQVIYTTHSSSMLNPMRPEQIRLLYRESNEGRAQSAIIHRASDANFVAVRSSLGISAADSLLFAPITVIVEGPTEIMCLPRIVEKLSRNPGFEDSKKVLSLCHFLDGMGDTFELLVRLALSHGTKVVLLLDGDKRHQVQQAKVQEKHPSIKIIFIKGNEEFEQIVPLERYFEALAVEIGANDGRTLLANWKEWQEGAGKVCKVKGFSKRIERWMEEAYEDKRYIKPSVMCRAIEISKPEEIDSAPLSELLNAVRAFLTDTSY
jgi:predicted ATP-dependent endonuclease of OLD family